MAVAGANIKLNELLICPVCLDTYREARTLACLHSFCTECLQGCLRVLRRDIECPVCKRVTTLSNAGVRGLPADYRIEQIRDFLAAGSQNVDMASASSEEKVCTACDVCKSQQRTTAASQHCVQCLMQLCDTCLQRHNANPVLSTHHVIAVSDSSAAASFFCSTHRQQPIRYFCCQCHSTLCTICAIEHDPLHKPESLETGIINKYRCRLSEALSSLASRLAEVKSRTKRLGALRQSRQNDLYSVQQNIRERAAQIIEHVKQRETALLADAQAKFETGFSAVNGSDSMAELDFRRCELEQLVNEIRQVLGGPPQSCLTVFDSLMARVSRLNESSLSNLPSLRLHASKSVCFIPAPESEMDLMIGCLQECSFGGSNEGSVDDSEGPSTTSSPSHSNVASPVTPGALSQETCSSTRKRTASILGALSPARKVDARMGRIKGVARTNSAVLWRDSSQKSENGASDTWRDGAQSSSANNSASWQSNSPTGNAWRENGWRDESASARRISFDSNIGSTTSSSDSPSSPVSRPVSVQSPASLVSSSLTKVGAPQSPLSPVASPVSRLATNTPPRLLFKIDQVGGLQGMIQSPVSVSFVASGDVLVAECDRRIQLFDRNGRSVRVIGWGNIKPQAVCVGPDGFIAIAEKTSQTIRFYFDDGRDAGMTRRWPDRMFGMPCSVAVGATTGQVIVADSDRRSVTIHSPGGAVMTRIASEHLGNPTHVAVAGDGTIYVSDSLHSCIKVFDSSGQFVRQFTLPPRTPQAGSSSNDATSVRPYGLCVSSSGQLYVCDRDGHRVLWYTSDGQFGGDLLQSVDSSYAVKYPCGVAVTQSVDNTGIACTLIAVAESCNGLLDNDRRHAVKLFVL